MLTSDIEGEGLVGRSVESFNVTLKSLVYKQWGDWLGVATLIVGTMIYTYTSSPYQVRINTI